MRITIMKCVFCLIATIFLTPFVARAKEIPAVVELGSECPNWRRVDENPFVTFASALKKDRKSTLFRVTWYGSLLSGWESGTLLYNRKTKLLKYFERGGIGEEGEYFYQKHYVFYGIREATFFGLVGTYNNRKRISELLPDSFLGVLSNRGYRKRRIENYTISKQASGTVKKQLN